MHFAAAIPWWAVGLVATAIAAVAFWSYRRPLAPLSGAQRWTLTALRAVALGLVALFLCRPVILLPPVADRDLVVPVLVDVSRSMRIADADGATRLARAAGIFEQDIAPSRGPPPSQPTSVRTGGEATWPKRWTRSANAIAGAGCLASC
jgi:hypothetical protein